MKLIKGSESLCLPADKTWVSVGFSKGHTAEDFGWLLKYPESKNQKLVAVSDAVVVQNTYYSDGGNTIWIGWTHGDHDYYAGYMHNKEKSNLQVGTELKQGDPIAIMGNTGTSRGEHVHLVLIKAPKGATFNNSNLRKYRIAPSSYPMYVYPSQEFRGGEVNIKPLPKPTPQPTPQPVVGLKVGDTVSYTGNVYATSSGKGKGAKVNGRFKVTILNNNAYGVHLGNLGWVKRSDVNASASTPQEKPKPVTNVGRTWRNILNPLPLYDASGNRHIKPSRATRNYKILAEKGDYYQIQHVLFNPRKVWVKKIDGRIS